MTITKKDWAKAFAKQALSDIRARNILASKDAEKCHQLHFLQMAAEKLCKAHMIGSKGFQEEIKTHAVVKRHLKTIARFYDRKDLCVYSSEIELLAPACNADGSRNDNTEYPWLSDDGKLQVPCEWPFSSFDDRKVVSLIKLIKTAAEAYTR